MSRDLSCEHEIPLAHRACLPALAPDVIRRAARDISTHTAASTDGFSMRHFALLSDDALALVSQLFACMEALGTIPQKLRFVLVVLIPKATSGLRPIGIFCALCRLWAKCRTVLAQAWEDLHPRPYFAASKGRAVIDPVWRHAAAVECGAVREQETVSVWRDFAQFTSAWNTTSLNATRTRSISLCLCSGSPWQLTRCSVCWFFMARLPPLDTPREEWSLDVPSPPIWSN